MTKLEKYIKKQNFCSKKKTIIGPYELIVTIDLYGDMGVYVFKKPKKEKPWVDGSDEGDFFEFRRAVWWAERTWRETEEKRLSAKIKNIAQKYKTSAKIVEELLNKYYRCEDFTCFPYLESNRFNVL